MNRLQKKCIIVSGGLHLMLLLILVVGPAFVSSKSQPDDTPILTFVALRTTDDQAQGGGNASAKPPAPAPVVPPVVQKPDPLPAEPMRDPTPPQKDNTPAVEPAQHKVVANLKPIVRNQNSSQTKTQSNKPRETADPNRNATRELNQALNGIRGGLSSSTTIDMPGPGGGGLPYANFLQAVKSVYANAWEVPEGVTDDSAIATVSVTIARDGTVLGSRITDPSGNAVVDRSVQVTLDRVRSVPPLPDDSKEAQRTVTIRFNVKAKLG